ncbi:MAG TPA: phospho-sugar mutase [Candidatus Limnocylindria bacterium]|nr:phospho-sugar mutase [Candidatus Limnocylindria bacterium]
MQQYRAWLEMAAGHEELRLELEGIRDDRKAIEDRFYTELAFGTGGMRGVLGAGINRMNVFTVRRAAAGLAESLKAIPGNEEKGVAVAYDSRRNSALFAEQTALVLAARGVKAYLFDSLRPVPVLSFAVRHLGTAAGVVITASHNPPQYNGFKAYGPDGAQLAPEDADRVTQEIRRLDYAQCAPMARDEALARGLLQVIGEEEVDRDYARMALSLMVRPDAVRARGASLRIVYTPLHGAGNLPVRRVLKDAGFEHVLVVPEQELPDPDFSTVKAPNPEDPAVFELGVKLAREAGASVVLATDPDCDRLGVCLRDGQGEFRTLTGNQIGCLLLHHILSERKRQGTLPGDGAAVKSIVSTRLAQAICDEFGVKLFDVLTGFKFVGELIQRFEETGSHTFLFGFEESFGYLSGTRVRDKDAVNASLLAAELACVCEEEGGTIFDRLQDIYRKYGYFVESVKSLDFPGKEGAANIAALMARLRDDPPRDIGGLKVLALRDYKSGLRTQGGASEPMGFPPSDVLYFELEGGAWACVRPSGTEPKIKLYTGISHPDSEEKAKEAARRLQEAAGSLLH